MALNFLETVKNYFTAEFVNQASNSLDESNHGISKALLAIIPSGLSGILSKATSGNEGANSIFNIAKDATGYLSPLPNLSNLHNDEKGSNIPSRIFGNNQSQVNSAISQYAGIKNSSVSALMTLAIPVIMGHLGKHAEQNNLSASGLSGFLSSQKDHIMQAMPAGLSSLAGILGLDSLGAAASSMVSDIKLTADDIMPTMADEPKRGAKWLLPLIIILIAIALLWYFSRSCNQTQSTENPVTTTHT